VVLRPPEREESLLPVIKVEFEGTLEIDRSLVPLNGVMELSPVQCCDLRRGASSGDDACSVDEGGALTQWHHPGDAIRWEVGFPSAGEYEIEIVTNNRRHSMPWVGGRIVEVEFSTQHVGGELREDKRIPSPYYHAAVSRLGRIRVSSGERGPMTLKTLNVLNHSCADMNLLSVKIQQTKNGELR